MFEIKNSKKELKLKDIRLGQRLVSKMQWNKISKLCSSELG